FGQKAEDAPLVEHVDVVFPDHVVDGAELTAVADQRGRQTGEAIAHSNGPRAAEWKARSRRGRRDGRSRRERRRAPTRTGRRKRTAPILRPPSGAAFSIRPTRRGSQRVLRV